MGCEKVITEFSANAADATFATISSATLQACVIMQFSFPQNLLSSMLGLDVLHLQAAYASVRQLYIYMV